MHPPTQRKEGLRMDGNSWISSSYQQSDVFEEYIFFKMEIYFSLQREVHLILLGLYRNVESFLTDDKAH